MRKLALVLFFLAPFAAHAQTTSHWVQIGPGGVAELRAVTSGHCPEAVIDGQRSPLQGRAEADANFQRLCSIILSPHVKEVSLEGVAITLPKAAPKRVAVLGDTGCRIKGGTVQDCNDLAKWPFPRVANGIAKR